MAFCGPDWLRGARRIEDLRHLMLTELLEEFDATRQWLVTIRNSVIQENEVTVTVRGRRQLWLLQREIDQGWSQVSKLFLSCDRSASVRNSLIDIHNTVTMAATKNRHSRLLPPPIFINGVLIPPAMPSKPGRVRRFLTRVRSRFLCDQPRQTKPVCIPVKSSDHSASQHLSLLGRLILSLRKFTNSRNKLVPV